MSAPEKEPICSNNPENAIHETKLIFLRFFKYEHANVKCQKQNNFQEHAVDPLKFEYAIMTM